MKVGKVVAVALNLFAALICGFSSILFVKDAIEEFKSND